MLSLEQVSFQYGQNTPLIRDISFEVAKGKIMGVLGHNGSGKATLLKLIARVLQPQSGTISILGKNIQRYERLAYYNRLGIMIEEPALYDHLSLKDNLDIFHRYRSHGDKYELYSYIERLDLADNLSKRPGKFSTGMRQRVALALALYFKPELLLLDEPTSGLDPNGIVLTRTLISDAKFRGASIVVTGHHLSEIERIADEFVILKEGKLIFYGPIEVIKQYRDLEEFYMAITQSKS